MLRQALRQLLESCGIGDANLHSLESMGTATPARLSYLSGGARWSNMLLLTCVDAIWIPFVQTPHICLDWT